ncbi:hypothetical protein M231_00958 [Tremella mesenterica]|uniref:Uncharacterized protein n=1 Tax=Tremella mesenterica TaxID=5217 RepID=A0A4Q1BUD4_TREME|nr:hypothetical protein M231_00958 [Tremella mesenterica]
MSTSDGTAGSSQSTTGDNRPQMDLQSDDRSQGRSGPNQGPVVIELKEAKPCTLPQGGGYKPEEPAYRSSDEESDDSDDSDSTEPDKNGKGSGIPTEGHPSGSNTSGSQSNFKNSYPGRPGRSSDPPRTSTHGLKPRSKSPLSAIPENSVASPLSANDQGSNPTERGDGTDTSVDTPQWRLSVIDKRSTPSTKSYSPNTHRLHVQYVTPADNGRVLKSVVDNAPMTTFRLPRQPFEMSQQLKFIVQTFISQPTLFIHDPHRQFPWSGIRHHSPVGTSISSSTVPSTTPFSTIARS